MNKLRASDYRKMAWDKISGKRTIMVVSYLILGLIISACGALLTFGIGAIGLLLITGPLFFGFAKMAYNCAINKPLEYEQLFDGFKSFVDTFVYALISHIFIFLWSLLFIIPGIIKTYSYSMGYYILIDNPGMSGDEARKRSMEIMKGNKWRLFCLQFSFIGWILLGILTGGILMLWVAPRMEIAKACFYESLKEKNVQSQVVECAEVNSQS